MRCYRREKEGIERESVYIEGVGGAGWRVVLSPILIFSGLLPDLYLSSDWLQAEGLSRVQEGVSGCCPGCLKFFVLFCFVLLMICIHKQHAIFLEETKTRTGLTEQQQKKQKKIRLADFVNPKILFFNYVRRFHCTFSFHNLQGFYV